MDTIATSLALFATLAIAGAAEKLTPIFEGKTLNGWSQCNGPAKYYVDKGEIVGVTAKGSPNSFLCSEKEYGDFILEFEVKDDPRLTENKGKSKRTHEAGRVAEVNLGRLIAGELVNPQRDESGLLVAIDQVGARDAVDPGLDRVSHRHNAEFVPLIIVEGLAGHRVAGHIGHAATPGLLIDDRLQDLGKRSWRPLFDGRTLSGWTKYGGGESTIEEGALRGVSPQATTQRGFLMMDREFGDFTVRLKYKAVKGNSRFFFRMGDPHSTENGAFAYEVEVDPTRDAGGLIEPRGRQWLAHGHRIVVHLNGEKTADLANDPGRSGGRLALQINPKQDLEVGFKDIEVLN